MLFFRRKKWRIRRNHGKKRENKDTLGKKHFFSKKMKQKTNSNSLFSLLFGFDGFYFPLLTKIWSDRKRKITISLILAKMKFFSLKREFFPVFFSFKKRLFIAFFEQSADFETSKKQPLGKRNISPTELAENLFTLFDSQKIAVSFFDHFLWKKSKILHLKKEKHPQTDCQKKIFFEGELSEKNSLCGNFRPKKS